MVAIAVLFAQGVFEHYLGMSSMGMDQALFDAILSGEEEDLHGLRWKMTGMIWTGHAGLWLLWLAAALTLITGVDYFRKSTPYLKD
jgi:CDP-diacylglycerol--glycerol-3-phosphate 3-phosphatidyltransferase